MKTLDRIYETIFQNLKNSGNEDGIITESVDKGNRFLRFVLPATIDFTLSQTDIEQAYPYAEYKKDVANGLTEKQIISKLENMVEALATRKINQINSAVSDTDIELQTIPTINNAQLYRFSFGMVVSEYKEIYNEEQQNLINSELSKNE
jgi:hypothetical protein